MPEYFQIIVIVILACLFFILFTRESFSSSGLTISDEYCNKLVDVYVDPVTDTIRNKICGHQRRTTVDPMHGNYFTMNGMLI